jgi:hypothetical protein
VAFDAASPLSMIFNLGTLVISIFGMWWFYDHPRPWSWLCFIFLTLASFSLYELLAPSKTKHIVLELAGMKWTREDFCRGWLITGATGCGKTASIMMRILFGLCTYVPDWGGMALDDKGLFYRILVKMFRAFGREKHLRLIQVRPDDAPSDWKPSDTWNPLDDKTMPYSAHAKIICDVAASFSSNSHPFFSQMAQIAMEYAMRGLDVADHYVTLTQVYNVTTNDDDLKALLADLSKIEGTKAKEAAEVDEYFLTRFLTLPPDTLGGLRGEMVRYLKFFTDERLAEIFSPKRGTVSLEDMDKSQVLCISIPQKYATERHYINTLAKFYFYLHALRRFDLHDHEMAKRTLLVLVSDENQNIVTASEHGMSDYKIVDRIREAGATIVAATQSPTSYFPAFKAKDKAMTYMNNLRNRVICTAADKEGAEISANLLPPVHMWERTFSSGRGGSGSNRKRVWKPPFEWGQLIRLKKFECIVQHCERGIRHCVLAPINERGIVPDWYKGKVKQIEQDHTSLRAETVIIAPFQMPNDKN